MNYTDYIIKECKQLGISIDVNDKQLMNFIKSFDEMPKIKVCSNGKVRVFLYKNTEMKDISFDKNGEYLYSHGIGLF